MGEFASVAPYLFNVLAPSVNPNSSDAQSQFAWDHNDVRYCLTEGISNGRGHWTHTWALAATLTTDQVEALFAEFVTPLNSTELGQQNRPQYQPWHVRQFSGHGSGE